MSATWLGTQDAYWTNGVNWVGGVSAYGWATATFNSAGNNRTNLSLAYTSPVLAMQHLWFRSPACAPYKIGLSTSQRYWMISGGSITVDNDVVNDQTIGGYVWLGNQDYAHALTFRNHSPVAALRFMGDLRFRSSATGLVTLRLEGAGEMFFNGNCVTNGTAQCMLFNYNTGRVTLAGMNRVNRLYTRQGLSQGNSHVTLKEGAELFLDYGSENYSIWHEGTGIIDGPGTLRFGKGSTGPARVYVKNGSSLTIRTLLTSEGGLEMYHSTGGGTLVLDCTNTMASDLIISARGGMVSIAKMGNQGAIDSNLGCGTSIFFQNEGNGCLIYTGSGETSDRLINFSKNARLDQSGTGDLILTQDLVVGANTKTLTLMGSGTGAGVIGGVIGPGSGTTSLAKEGSGLWRLTAANTYTGTTTVRDGTLTLCGANGAVSATSAVVLEGGTLCLSNAVTANAADRLADTAGITLNGGCLAFVNGGGAADYSETLGALMVSEEANVIKTTSAAAGQSSTLTFASLTRSGRGVVDFQGEGLGEAGSTRNRILFTTPPQTTAGGYIGSWATVNGTALAKYDTVRGVYADPTEIAARGPDSVIPDNPVLDVRIATDGVSGPITLETATGASIFNLTQASATPATVSMTGQTLTTLAVRIAEEGAALTLGEMPGEGVLKKGTAFDEILFDNRSSHPLTVNAAFSESESDTTLTKRGSGTVNLSGPVTMSGLTCVLEGELVWGALPEDSTHTIGSFVEMTGGKETPVTVRFNGASQLTGVGDFWVGTNAGDRCVVVLDGGLSVQALPGETGRKMYVGNGLGVSGAIIQHSGVLNVSTGVSAAAFHVVGNSGGYGYHRITGGELCSGEVAVGGPGTAGVGNAAVMDLFGGKVTLDKWCLLVGWTRGVAALNLFGGSYGGGDADGGELLLGYANNHNITAQVNLLGSDAKMFDRGASLTQKRINLARGGTNILGAVNLNAGELTLYKADAWFGNNTPNTTTPTHFNFNGGLLKAAATTTTLIQGLTAAYVRPGGARIDTDGYNVTINQPLVAPTGYGLSTVALASGGAGYIGAPAVLVSGGAGIGATAIALVDLEPESPLCGQVTNILVTAAGSGYGTGDKLSVELRGGGCLTPAVVGQVTLAENISGGLVKLGNGTLTLGGTGTFTGGTTVSGGTLKFGCVDALLPGSAIVVEEEGTLDLGAFTVTNTVSGSGPVVNGTLYTEFSPGGTPAIGTQLITTGQGGLLEGVYLLDVTADGTCDKLTLNGDVDVSSVVLRVVDATQLNRRKRYAVAQFSAQTTGMFITSNLPDDRWHLQRAENGTVWLYFSDGMVFMLK